MTYEKPVILAQSIVRMAECRQIVKEEFKRWKNAIEKTWGSHTKSKAKPRK